MSTPLFLDPSAAYTLTPIIWIGICVLCWLNLSWGVALSGLIVPGFLVPLAMIYPASGALVLVEAIMTWGITRAICARLPGFSLGSSFFGRDRFFALVLCSIFVRIFMEGGLLPWVTAFGYRASWFPEIEIRATAFGLILVPLIANQLWKPGLVRGLAGLTAACTLTFLIFNLFFIPLSGFSLANLAQQMDLTTQYLPDSPQSYIILLTTIFLASRLNLHYGWDFSGIMFPGLIALSLFDPSRIISTIVETMVLVILAKLLMLWPPIRAKALTGAYSLALFFTISFAYKVLLGSFIPQLFSTARSDDFLGLGYIMSSLFAIKICRLKNHGPNLASTLTQASVLGLVIGLFCSTALSSVGSLFLSAPTPEVHVASAVSSSSPEKRYPFVVHSDKSLSRYVYQSAQSGLFAAASSEAYTPPSKDFLDQLMGAVVRPLLRLANQQNLSLSDKNSGLSSRVHNELRQLAQRAGQHGFSLEIIAGDQVQKPRVVLKDRVEGRNLGMMIVTMKPDRALGLAVGDPFRDKNSLEFGLWSLEKQNLAFIVTPTVHPRARFDGTAALTHPANRINFVNAVLSQVNDMDFPSMRIIELTSAPADQKRQQIAINPGIATEEGALREWIHDLEKYGMPSVNGPDVSPTLVFETTLSLVRKQLYTVQIPGWVQRRMVSLLAPAEWEARWPLMNRPLVKSESRPDSTLLPDTLSREALQDIKAYLVDNNPLKLLEAEARDSLLRFDLLKVERNYFLVIKHRETDHAVALTEFPFGAELESGLAMNKRTSAL